MSQLRYLFLVCSIAFFACTNDVAGTWEDENTLALQSSSSVAESSAESSSSETKPSSSEERLSSSQKSLSSSSETLNSSSSSIDGIHFPPPIQCAVSPRALKAVATYGVVDAFIAKRVAALTEQGLNSDSAKNMATEELYRELGLDTLFQDRPQITDEQLEYTLFFLYKNREKKPSEDTLFFLYENEGTNELSPAIVEDFADGKLEPENYCINGISFADLDYLPKMYLNLGCYYGDEVSNSLAILRNIWRKCSNMPYCNENVGDTIITIGKDHFVCENKSWITLEMQGKEINGQICNENGSRIKADWGVYRNVTYICHEGYWRNISESADLPAEYFFNPDFEYGTFTDPRDGHVYKTTVYEGQTWLAQDIDYYDSSDTLFSNQSRCPKSLAYRDVDEDKNKYCNGASRFYTVNASKKACPEGWRLPRKEDWQTISYNVKTNETLKLFVKESHVTGIYRNATDEFGLSLRLDGSIEYSGGSWYSHNYNMFWLEEGEYVRTGDFSSVFSSIDPRGNGEFIPVRCIKK
ncbi:putative lipoprotein [Fibrobacter succinogenes subsp. succinogenes S85]|uniref:Putative lipoprotein n=1 Tax=Fibrobacter succinogenes (strain ATCC 19169 / S85) TaxID=59374 RepID=C9RQP8_FIBSS|nr:FISUMP domain-containing protein [Fibrobacter succinogenes]ACX74884.1 hypothetical protein Fisuc_1284 [Fibrobacter succinogenes subsp. succinogenes S85]ADL27372.1 putative lipoprotein [Fibrobacter succinogenes subsp. succinogenes S85]